MLLIKHDSYQVMNNIMNNSLILSVDYMKFIYVLSPIRTHDPVRCDFEVYLFRKVLSSFRKVSYFFALSFIAKRQ